MEQKLCECGFRIKGREMSEIYNKYIGCWFVDVAEDKKELVPCDLGQENQSTTKLPGEWGYDKRDITFIESYSWDGKDQVLIYVPVKPSMEIKKAIIDFLLSELDDHDGVDTVCEMWNTNMPELYPEINWECGGG